MGSKAFYKSMKITLDDKLSATLFKGGVQEYIETGVYSRTLRIESEKYDAFWNVKIETSKVEEILMLDEISLYRISLMVKDDDAPKLTIQELTNREPTSEWIELDLDVLMVD